MCGVECSKVPTVYYNKVYTLLVGLLFLPSVVLSTLLSPNILDKLISLFPLVLTVTLVPFYRRGDRDSHMFHAFLP